jgi:hypothetical protein
MAYDNIYSSMRNPYATAKPGSREPDTDSDSDYSPTGYDRQYRPPSKKETPGNALDPLTTSAPPPVAPPAAPPPAPEAVMSGGVSPSPAGGPAGVGGSGGFGFTNLAQYLYSNPMGSGPGSGYAPTPTGMQASDFNSDVHGFTPGGAYTPGMAGVDNALNQTYGRSTATPDVPAGMTGASAGAGAPSAPVGPAGPSDDPMPGGNRQRPEYPNLNRYMRY